MIWDTLECNSFTFLLLNIVVCAEDHAFSGKCFVHRISSSHKAINIIPPCIFKTNVFLIVVETIRIALSENQSTNCQ